MPVEPRKPKERTEPIKLREPLSVQNWVREHSLYKEASTARDTLLKRVSELEALIVAADGLHRVAMSTADEQLLRIKTSRDELDGELRDVRAENTQLQTEVRDLTTRLCASSEKCA